MVFIEIKMLNSNAAKLYRKRHQQVRKQVLAIFFTIFFTGCKKLKVKKSLSAKLFLYEHVLKNYSHSLFNFVLDFAN